MPGSLSPDPRWLDCRRLFLRNYEAWIDIGVHEHEKRGKQRVRVNVDLFVSLAASTPRQDSLHEVVDYDFIRDTIAARLGQGHVQLQETLCDDLLALMLAHPLAKAARVSTEKWDAYPDCEAVGVEVWGVKPPLEGTQ
jgi:dihydroneopterin aldolase